LTWNNVGSGIPITNRLVTILTTAVEYRNAVILTHVPFNWVFQAFATGVHWKMLTRKAAV
jgi:hypothetical protein